MRKVAKKYNRIKKYKLLKGREGEIVEKDIKRKIRKYGNKKLKRFLDSFIRSGPNNTIKFGFPPSSRMIFFSSPNKNWLIFPFLKYDIKRKNIYSNISFSKFGKKMVLAIIDEDENVEFYSHDTGRKLDPVGSMSKYIKSMNLTKKQKEILFKISSYYRNKKNILSLNEYGNSLKSLLDKGLVETHRSYFENIRLTKKGKRAKKKYKNEHNKKI